VTTLLPSWAGREVSWSSSASCTPVEAPEGARAWNVPVACKGDE
jgi:hypothetical protein